MLSAVDPQVGKHIFDKCIAGTMAGKTRILVTHQLQYLSQADRIIVLDEGRIVFNGSYREIVDSAINISEFIKDSNLENVDGEEGETKETEEVKDEPIDTDADIVDATEAPQGDAGMCLILFE